jgi:hypothetical protein
MASHDRPACSSVNVSLSSKSVVLVYRHEEFLQALKCQFSAARDGVGRALTYATTVAAQPSVPGSRSPGKAAPLSVTGYIDGRQLRLRASLLEFNWADRKPRWEHIVSDIAPSCQRLVETRPGEMHAILAMPFRDFVDTQRVVRRIPDLVRDLSTGWELVEAQ